MFDPKIFDEMAKKFTENLPTQFQVMKADIENNFRTALQFTFSKLDLVTRQEFDIQTQVLAKTREKIEQLEAQVKALEEKINPSK